jgi:hypothetical protein
MVCVLMFCYYFLCLQLFNFHIGEPYLGVLKPESPGSRYFRDILNPSPNPHPSPPTSLRPTSLHLHPLLLLPLSYFSLSPTSPSLLLSPLPPLSPLPTLPRRLPPPTPTLPTRRSPATLIRLLAPRARRALDRIDGVLPRRRPRPSPRMGILLIWIPYLSCILLLILLTTPSYTHTTRQHEHTTNTNKLSHPTPKTTNQNLNPRAQPAPAPSCGGTTPARTAAARRWRASSSLRFRP